MSACDGNYCYSYRYDFYAKLDRTKSNKPILFKYTIGNIVLTSVNYGFEDGPLTVHQLYL
jgi:hypothetical protein